MDDTTLVLDNDDNSEPKVRYFLYTLPEDVILNIAYNLWNRDIYAFATSCKEFQKQLQDRMLLCKTSNMFIETIRQKYNVRYRHHMQQIGLIKFTRQISYKNAKSFVEIYKNIPYGYKPKHDFLTSYTTESLKTIKLSVKSVIEQLIIPYVMSYSDTLDLNV